MSLPQYDPGSTRTLRISAVVLKMWRTICSLPCAYPLLPLNEICVSGRTEAIHVKITNKINSLLFTF